MYLKFFLTIIFLISSSILARPYYDLKDLEVLTIQKNYLEFLNHAHDIRPSKRGKKWKDMVQKMALGYINQLLNFKSFEQKNFDFVERLNSWSSFKDIL